MLSRLLCAIVFALLSCEIQANIPMSAPDKDLVMLEELISKPEHEIDLAASRLAIEKIIDPGVDIVAAREKLSMMASQVKTLLPPHPSQRQILLTLHRYIYEPGAWNFFKPFSYDLDDPLGQRLSNKLLSNYIYSRKGNCVSMPALLLLLGRELGLDMHFAKAPRHLYVIYRDDKGGLMNLEATSGGTISNERLKTEYPMTQQAIRNGLYMTPMTNTQSVMDMVLLVAEYYHSVGEQEKRIAVADIVLKYHPRNADAMVHKGQAYVKMLKKEFLTRYKTPKEIPATDRSRFNYLANATNYWYDEAEALGFKQDSEASKTAYLNRIQQVKTAQH